MSRIDNAERYSCRVNTALAIDAESPRQSGVAQLLDDGRLYAASLAHPDDANSLLTVSQLEAPGVALYVARDDDGTAIGMVAIIDDLMGASGRGELKRLFVDAANRGTGAAEALLRRAETDAVARGLTELVLESGTLHLPALAFYAKHGYRRIPAFGPYIGSKYSICMSKSLVSFG